MSLQYLTIRDDGFHDRSQTLTTISSENTKEKEIFDPSLRSLFEPMSYFRASTSRETARAKIKTLRDATSNHNRYSNFVSKYRIANIFAQSQRSFDKSQETWRNRGSPNELGKPSVLRVDHLQTRK